jgi:nucleotide-binding universal stress UspA family protein
MTPSIVVSYDGTPDDDDAIALGMVFAKAGASITLAYVRHSRLEDPKAEEREQVAADALLARGAAKFGADTKTCVLFDPSTAAALRSLIEREGHDMIVFGSSYRTPAGHIAPGRAAQQLIDGSPAAVALAPAGLRNAEPLIETIAVASAQSGDAAEETASSLAAKLGAQLIPSPDPTADLLVLASRPDAPAGRVSISAASEQIAELAACPVVVVANGKPLSFGA